MITKIQKSARFILFFAFLSANLLQLGLSFHLHFEHESKLSRTQSNKATLTADSATEYYVQKNHIHIFQTASYVARIPNNFQIASHKTLYQFIVTNSFFNNQLLPDISLTINLPPILLHLLDCKSHIHSGISPPIA